MGAVPEVQSGVLFSAVVVWGGLVVLFTGMGACDCPLRRFGPWSFFPPPRGFTESTNVPGTPCRSRGQINAAAPSDGLCPAQAERSV